MRFSEGSRYPMTGWGFSWLVTQRRLKSCSHIENWVNFRYLFEKRKWAGNVLQNFAYVVAFHWRYAWKCKVRMIRRSEPFRNRIFIYKVFAYHLWVKQLFANLNEVFLLVSHSFLTKCPCMNAYCTESQFVEPLDKS